MTDRVREKTAAEVNELLARLARIIRVSKLSIGDAVEAVARLLGSLAVEAAKGDLDAAAELVEKWGRAVAGVLRNRKTRATLGAAETPGRPT